MLRVIVTQDLTLRGMGRGKTELTCPVNTDVSLPPLVVIDMDGTRCGGTDPCQRVGEPFEGVLMAKYPGVLGDPPNVVIEDLAIVDCDAGMGSAIVVAGMHDRNVAKLTARRVSFRDNRSMGDRPAAIYGYLAELRIEDCRFVNNSSPDSCGSALKALRSRLRIMDTTFKGNVSSSGEATCVREPVE